MTPKEYVKKRQKLQGLVQKLYQEQLNLLMEVDPVFPANVRPARPVDVVVDNIFWYKDFDDGEGYKIIEEVLRPEDPWKAYIAEDGCRYGTEGAFVEVT